MVPWVDLLKMCFCSGILKWHQFLIHIRGLDLVKAQVQPIKWIHLITFSKYGRL